MEIPNKENVLTKKGFDELNRELDELLKVRRPAVVSRIHEALKAGDLRENFDYHDAKREQGMIESRIAQLKRVLDGATVMECPSQDGCIGFGSKVMVRDVDDGFEDEYLIVAPAEADPSEGKISFESSVGSALMGRKIGDIIDVETPGGKFKYEVVSVQ